MEFNIGVRKKQLESLDQYISSSKDKVQSILDCLGWSVDKLLQKDDRISCPVDNKHLIHPKSVQIHTNKCMLLKEGYNLNEELLSEPLQVNNNGQSVNLGLHEKIEVLSRAHLANPGFKADLYHVVIKFLKLVINSISRYI